MRLYVIVVDVKSLTNYFSAYMGITYFPLPRSNGNLLSPFFVVITLFFSWIIIINSCICLLTGSPGKYFSLSFMLYGKLG